MKKDTIRVWQDRAEEWRWTLIAANGEPIGDSAEGYADKGHALRMAERVRGDAVLVVEHEGEGDDQ